MSFANLRPAAGHRLCRNLRCKEMYYTSQEQMERWQADPVRALEGRSFWCLKTFTALGPESEPCDAAKCNPERGCYEG
ncbi:MAG: hypothetical protein FJ293_00920 [Planctomycetes bacterium]|nr:hypothetical protein [Planctomycetota bacterium]